VSGKSIGSIGRDTGFVSLGTVRGRRGRLVAVPAAAPGTRKAERSIRIVATPGMVRQLALAA
jgi:hypothetical protein